MNRWLSLVALSLSLTTLTAHAAEDEVTRLKGAMSISAKALPSVPSSWTLEKELKGDLSKDGKEDRVWILLQKASAGEEFPSVARVVTSFIQNADGTFTQAGFSDAAILNPDEGGVMGDPFADASITAKGILVISHYGGSSDRWANDLKFRYQKGQMYLIGYTSTNFSVHEPDDQEVVDVNLSTGDVIKTVTKSGKATPQKKKVATIKPIALNDIKEDFWGKTWW